MKFNDLIESKPERPYSLLQRALIDEQELFPGPGNSKVSDHDIEYKFSNIIREELDP
jgi:hypothetical protein